MFFRSTLKSLQQFSEGIQNTAITFREESQEGVKLF